MSRKKKPDASAVTFPRLPPCPRCHSMDTRPTSTQGRIQYRQCSRVGCYHRFAVKPIAPPDGISTPKDAENANEPFTIL